MIVIPPARDGGPNDIHDDGVAWVDIGEALLLDRLMPDAPTWGLDSSDQSADELEVGR